jgi:GDSL-like Lipase/Acylhydrolase family
MTVAPPSASPGIARIDLMQTILLLAISLLPCPSEWDTVRSMIDSARSPELNRAEREGHIAGYYEDLIGGSEGRESWQGEPSLRLIGKPSGWVRFQEADVVHYLKGDFLQFELKPLVHRTLFGQPFQTNAFGMHDGPVAVEKPPDTFRIAVLGSSMDMGWGVRYDDTYLNQFERWLDSHAARRDLGPRRRFEVLNFAVAAYSPMQRLETLRRKVRGFRPDLVIYSATTLDTRLMEIHLCDMLRKNIDLKFDFLGEATALAEIVYDDIRIDAESRIINKDRLKTKLRPLFWGLYDTALGEIAAECRAAGVPIIVVIIPRVGKADAPSARAESVARLKAIAAHHGLTVFDLADVFDPFDPVSLEIAAWDDHPNATGHRRLFLGLARAVVKNREVYHLLFDSNEGLTQGRNFAESVPPADRRDFERRVKCSSLLGTVTRPDDLADEGE